MNEELALRVTGICVQGVSACFQWFNNLMGKMALSPLFLGMFAIAMVYRFLLAPLLGGSVGSSDTVKGDKKSSEKGDND